MATHKNDAQSREGPTGLPILCAETTQGKIDLDGYVAFSSLNMSQKDTPLRPIVSSINASTTGISKMLDTLIRPLFDKYVSQTTFIDGVHFIRRLETYVSLGLLKPTTHFCTFDIIDLYTMLPQEEAIAILRKFLVQHGHSHVRGISCPLTIDTIELLARAVLTENVFVYNGKYFRQILGGAMGSPFLINGGKEDAASEWDPAWSSMARKEMFESWPAAHRYRRNNIFMWNWEQSLVEHQKNANELYGR